MFSSQKSVDETEIWEASFKIRVTLNQGQDNNVWKNWHQIWNQQPWFSQTTCFWVREMLDNVWFERGCIIKADPESGSRSSEIKKQTSDSWSPTSIYSENMFSCQKNVDESEIWETAFKIRVTLNQGDPEWENRDQIRDQRPRFTQRTCFWVKRVSERVISERAWQTDRQTDRHTDTQTDTQTHRQDT